MSIMMTVGIRELRQNPTPAIEEAKAGRTVTITQRGVPVAQITPPSDDLERGPWERLAAEGQIRFPATATRRPLPPPLPPQPGEELLSETIRREREDERW